LSEIFSEPEIFSDFMDGEAMKGEAIGTLHNIVGGY